MDMKKITIALNIEKKIAEIYNSLIRLDDGKKSNEYLTKLEELKLWIDEEKQFLQANFCEQEKCKQLLLLLEYSKRIFDGSYEPSFLGLGLKELSPINRLYNYIFENRYKLDSEDINDFSIMLSANQMIGESIINKALKVIEITTDEEEKYNMKRIKYAALYYNHYLENLFLESNMCLTGVPPIDIYNRFNYDDNFALFEESMVSLYDDESQILEIFLEIFIGYLDTNIDDPAYDKKTISDILLLLIHDFGNIIIKNYQSVLEKAGINNFKEQKMTKKRKESFLKI